MGDEAVDEVEGDEMDFVGGLFRGVYAPPGTPEGRTEWLSDAFEEAVEDDRTQEWSDETGNPVYHEGPERAEEIGFAGVMAGPLVRSSYRAGKLYAQAMERLGREVPAHLQHLMGERTATQEAAAVVARMS